jgi:predicted transcriptional regulator
MNRKCRAVIWVLNKQPGMLALDIAQIIGVWRMNIYVLLGSMEEDNLIRGIQDPGRFGRTRYYLNPKLFDTARDDHDL